MSEVIVVKPGEGELEVALSERGEKPTRELFERHDQHVRG